MREFQGKVAVVTGAASGIGRGLAEAFAERGMRVVLADVEEEALQETERALRDAGADVFATRTDVSQEADVRALGETTIERFGGVHVVCNNAGVTGGGLSWDQPLSDWEWVLGVNLWGVIHGIRTFVPLMLAGGEEGHIVNTASVAGLMAGAGGAGYTTTKFGVVGLSEVLHFELQEFASEKIGVSVLCPGATDTRIIDSDRNRPDGPFEAPVEGSPEAAGREFVRQILRSGQSPRQVAERVIQAIENGEFYVLTHPELNGVVSRRAEAIVSGGAPVALGPV